MSEAQRQAKGHLFRGRQRIVCDIDPEDFDVIRKTELPGCISMASKIRLLVEWGLMALDDNAETRK